MYNKINEEYKEYKTKITKELNDLKQSSKLENENNLAIIKKLRNEIDELSSNNFQLNETIDKITDEKSEIRKK